MAIQAIAIGLVYYVTSVIGWCADTVLAAASTNARGCVVFDLVRYYIMFLNQIKTAVIGNDIDWLV